MVQKPVNAYAAGYGNTRNRTPDSMVWKDTKAKDLTSSVRFSWDKYQKIIFENFLKTVGLSFKTAELSPLLYQLNLDGYDDINTKQGQNVHSLIMEKVRRKLKNTADGMDQEVLMRASFAPAKAGPSPREKVFEEVPTRDHRPPQPTKTSKPTRLNTPSPSPEPLHEEIGSRRDAGRDKPDHPQPSHPFLKMPQQQVPPPSPQSSPQREVKTEPGVRLPEFTGIPFPFGSSGASRPGAASSTGTAPSFESRSLPTPDTSPGPDNPFEKLDSASLARADKALRTIQNFVSVLTAAESDLYDVEYALDALGPVKGGSELATAFHHMRNAFYGLQGDADDIEELATKKLQR
ncbi:hypothetical protein GGR54DRAFT_592533 [Hypoxylon sp. NC1633]|nr:hypothetical protein GGR54DRAFT_592533 [Hypoxylon sp. NC1633]